jgi:hypothetical protein
MLNKNVLHKFFCLVLILFPAACSSVKVKIANDIMPANLRSLAVLPVDYPSDIQREKTDAIVKSIKSELKNKNFVVLADRLVNGVCSNPACPERKTLAEKYQVDAFVTVDVKSVSRTNFVAGFYNAIKGKLILSDVNSKNIVEVEHTQSEKGGLLFNSGQVVQAIISYGENKEADSFAKLSTGFAETLVSKIPHSKESNVNSDAVAVAINEIKVKELRPEIFQICADATPDSLVSVIVNRQSTNLRPVKEGNYCGTFLYNQISSNQDKVYVDARSPFGNSVRKEVEIAKEAEICDLNDNVILSEKNGKPSIHIACVDLAAGKGISSINCPTKVNVCPGNKFIVFKASSNLGPYEKIAEFQSTNWVDNNAKKGTDFYYELVSVNKAGVWSLPVSVKSVSKS